MARPRPDAWEGPDDDRFDDEEDGPEDEDGDECDDNEDDVDETGVRQGRGRPAAHGQHGPGRDGPGGHRSGGHGASGHGSSGYGPGWRDLGMATAEYAIATLAACGFAGLLLVLLRSSEVRGLLSGIIRRALSVG